MQGRMPSQSSQQMSQSGGYTSGYSGGQMTHGTPDSMMSRQRVPAQQPSSQIPHSQQGPPGQTSGQSQPIQAMMSMQQKASKIAPVAKPQGLDPIVILNERENRYVLLNF